MWIVDDRSAAADQASRTSPAKRPRSPVSAIHHHRQTVNGPIDLLHRPVDHPPDRGVLPADDLPAGDQRRQPVEEMEERAAGDAGKEVLCASGEADDLMGKDRPQDDDQVVIEDAFVDIDRHPLPEKTAGNRRHLFLGELSDPLKGLRQIPAVAEKIGPAGQLLSGLRGYPIEIQDLLRPS